MDQYILRLLEEKVVKAILAKNLNRQKVSGAWNNVINILYKLWKNHTTVSDINSKCPSKCCFQGHNLHI